MSLLLETNIVTISPYNVINSDTVIFVNRNSPSTVILPLLVGDDHCGRSFYIKDFSGTSTVNPITITASGGKLINGVSFAILNGAYSHIQVVYDGTNWMTIA